MKRAKWWIGLLSAVGLVVRTQGQLQASEMEVHGKMPLEFSQNLWRGLELRNNTEVPALYMVLDLSAGCGDDATYPVSFLAGEPSGGWGDEYKTTKLVLRWIPAGTFTMGSPRDEVGGGLVGQETQHEVTISTPFFMGVFEVTQAQWELVMGRHQSSYPGKMRPVELVSHSDIRGSLAGAGWPESAEVDATSFMGRLRARASGLAFDLPTEAQWEYACRAGTKTALNSGKNLTDANQCPNMAEVGRYYYNSTRSSCDGVGGYSEHTKVGCYQPNAWGLYDMHGNVWEMCRDWYVGDLGSQAETDPVGPASGDRWVQRGGSWYESASYCRSAYRNTFSWSLVNNTLGFRLACSAGGLPPIIVGSGATEARLPDGTFSIIFTLHNFIGGYDWRLAGEGNLSEDGVYTWIPTETGSFEIKVSAVDNETLIADKTLTLTVKDLAAMYTVEVAIDISNGMIAANKTEAEENEIVTLTASPASGYQLDTFLVDGMPLSGNTFVMPAHDVLVSAIFTNAFVKITSLDELEEGEYVITGAQFAGEEYAMMAAVSPTSTKYLQRREKAVELETDTITDAEDSIIWTLAQDSDGWTIYNSAVGYVGYLNSGNSANAEASPSTKSRWSISAANGLFLLTNVGNTERYLLYNASAPRFSCYTRTTSGKQLALYKLTAVANANINWTGTTDIEIGETFEIQFLLENYDGDYSWVVQSGNGSISEEGFYSFTPVETGSYSVTVAAVVDGTTLATSETVELSATEAESATTTGVPYAWLSDYGLGDGTPEGFEAAANATAANGINTVAECYVAGLNPTDKASTFSADISFSNGQPVVTWTPDLNENGTRSYVLEGTPTMTNVWDATNAASRFFRVKVALP